jgi:cysteine desulfurase
MEDVPAIVGFGAAAAGIDVGQEGERSRHLTGRVLAAAREIDGVTTYGDIDQRLPHIACLAVEGIRAEAVLLGLDQAGIAAHSGSSCSSESLEPSPVLTAMGVDPENSLRISTGWSTLPHNIDAFLAALPSVLERLRALGADG